MVIGALLSVMCSVFLPTVGSPICRLSEYRCSLRYILILLRLISRAHQATVRLDFDLVSDADDNVIQHDSGRCQVDLPRLGYRAVIVAHLVQCRKP